MVGGVQVLAVPEFQLAVWRPELVLAATALLSLAPLVWQGLRLRVPVMAGLALATGLAATAIPFEAVAPAGPHFLLDGPASLARLVVVALALVVHLALRPHDARAGALLALAALGCSLLAQAATLGGLLTAVAITVLGGGLAAWYAGRDSSRIAAAQWLGAGGLGFGVLTFAGVLWCGVAGTLDLAAVAPALALRPSLPPLALPILLCLGGAGLALALLTEPDRFHSGDGEASAPVLVGWITVAPAVALAAMLQRVFAGAESAPGLSAAPTLMVAMAGILAVGGFVAASVQERLPRRLAWAATGQAGLALLGFVATPTGSVVGLPLAILLAMAPAHLGAMLLAGAPAEGRWREPQLMVLSGLLVSLAALPPLAGWRPRLDLVAGLQTGDQQFALIVVAVGSLLALVVYLRPLADLWRHPSSTDAPGDQDAPPASRTPLIPTLLAAALLAGVVGWGLGLLDPVAVLP